MKIFVKAKPGAKVEKIIKISENHFEVSVTERPEKGRANAAILRALGKHFYLAPSRLEIISSHGARNKIVEIL